jgi:hypothetical protein
LPVGAVTFPFTFQIPTVNYPAPLQIGCNYISYVIRSNMDRPFKTDFHSNMIPLKFTPALPVDLPQYMQVSRLEKIEKISCMFNCGSVQGSFEIPKTGYLVGMFFN